MCLIDLATQLMLIVEFIIMYNSYTVLYCTPLFMRFYILRGYVLSDYMHLSIHLTFLCAFMFKSYMY